MIRVRAIGVIPEDNSSSVSVIGGHVSTSAQPAPEIDFSYFFTDNIAAELIAATTRHTLTATGTAAGNVDVGSTYVLPPTLTSQYHFLPREQFSPYVGVGLNASFFYDIKAAGPTITSLSVNNSWGPAIQAGVDYNFAGHWFANLDVKQIFLNTATHVSAGALRVKAKTDLDPLVAGAGIGYRF
jgi:outer membrane protein